MKIIITVLVFLVVPFISFADTWCEWNGTQGVNCLNDSRGYIRVPSDHPDRTLANNVVLINETILNNHGFYKLTTTQPVIGANQVKDSEVWGLVGNQMSLTWTVRDMTTTEIDERDARVMSLNDYLQWKVLVHPTFGIITAAQLRTYLETNYPEVIDGFEARDRLENP